MSWRDKEGESCDGRGRVWPCVRAPVSSAGSPCFALQISSAVPGVPWTRSDWLSQYRESRSISLRWTFNPADALHWLSIENRHLTTAAHFSYPFVLSLFFPALSRLASHSIRTLGRGKSFPSLSRPIVGRGMLVLSAAASLQEYINARLINGSAKESWTES